jgi:hypothetical protein
LAVKQAFSVYSKGTNKMDKCKMIERDSCEDCDQRFFSCNAEECKDHDPEDEFYQCKCDCGNHTVVCGKALRNGWSTSCQHCN